MQNSKFVNRVKRIVIAGFMLICVSFSTMAHRENSYYLHGNVGGKELVIQIDEYGDACLARYFTPKDRYDHILEGRIPQVGTFYLFSGNRNETGENVVSDSLYIVEYALDKWKGTWTSKDGETTAFSLYPIDIGLLDHPFESAVLKYGLSPYSAYRTKDVGFIQSRQIKVDRKIYVKELKDTLVGIAWFRVEAGKKINVTLDSINSFLVAEHLNAINATYSCVHFNNKGDYSIRYKIHFLNNEYISYSVITNASCYGSPGQNIETFSNLYMENARQIMLEDLFWFGDERKPDIKEGEYQWFQYRYKVFGPKILAMMTDLYPQKIVSKTSGDCQYDDVKVWQFPNWYLTFKGLYLGSKSPITNRSCDNPPWAIIPYKKLKEFEQMGHW